MACNAALHVHLRDAGGTHLVGPAEVYHIARTTGQSWGACNCTRTPMLWDGSANYLHNKLN